MQTIDLSQMLKKGQGIYSGNYIILKNMRQGKTYFASMALIRKGLEEYPGGQTPAYSLNCHVFHLEDGKNVGESRAFDLVNALYFARQKKSWQKKCFDDTLTGWSGEDDKSIDFRL